ncbi:MAG: helix-turn-helix domain-containing protein [Rhizobiaceae bacterium]|nr:helix-turn-helix domain-containing protein [Rhizobiaceae bacterium]MCV0405195.1 helix-turn-helix domain-containing protein [Rhizobiaceae bacterium]
MYSIGELARRTGVKVPTIRYYEQTGLIDPPERTGGNQRRYRKTDLDRLAFIRHARDLGFSIEAVRDLTRLARHPGEACAEADRIARDHLADTRRRIEALKRLETELARIAGLCDAGRTVSECRVLEALGDHHQCLDEHPRAE